MSLWYYYDEMGKQGPIQPSELKTLAELGQIDPETIVETDTGKKAKAGAVKGLFPNSNKLVQTNRQTNKLMSVPITETPTKKIQTTQPVDVSSTSNNGTKVWFYYENDIKTGPFPISTLIRMARSGIITRETLLEDSNGIRVFAEDMDHIFNFNSSQNKPDFSPQIHMNSETRQPTQVMQTNVNFQVNGANNNEMSEKNRITAAILAFFAGVFGAHKFYLGNSGSGLLYFILTCTGIGLILTLPWTIIETIDLFTMSDKMFHQKYG